VIARTAALALAALVWAAQAAPAQERPRLRLVAPGGEIRDVAVESHRGYAAVSASVLERIGWTVRVGEDGARAELGRGVRVRVRAGNPFFHWNDDLRQMVEAPYFFGERLHLPLQLLTDYLPRKLGDGYAWSAEDSRLLVLADSLWTDTDGPAGGGTPSEESPAPPARPASTTAPGGVPPSPDDGVRVVVIDPGHGGKDEGARGAGGVREKEVALGVARALTRELATDSWIDVRLTRARDDYMPLWARGDSATAWKGERPGIFVSLHANAAARSRSVRGFETYFLSEARTEHERRVAALENAPLGLEENGGPGARGENPDLSFILNELRNHDSVHWSSLLAEMVQEELDRVHPGPNRGVKQGPFAVITNALMPGILVELGFITNGPEERLLGQERFQEDAARALARAIRSFFERYPPRGAATNP